MKLLAGRPCNVLNRRGSASREHCLCHDSDPTKLERIQRKDSRAVEHKLKLCPIVMTPWGVQAERLLRQGG